MSEEINTEINLTNVRISYPNIFEPFVDRAGKKGKYGAVFMLHKKEHAALITSIQQKIKAVLAVDFKDASVKPAGEKLCLRDGDSSGRAEYEGYWTLNASESTRPVVVDRNRSPLTAEDDVIYAGCRVNAKVKLWSQKSAQWGNRINANLLGIQFQKDDERLGTGRVKQTAEDLFEDVSGSFGDDAGEAGGENDPFA